MLDTDLEAVGYLVEIATAATDTTAAVLRVSRGPDLVTYVRADDEETITLLVAAAQASGES